MTPEQAPKEVYLSTSEANSYNSPYRATIGGHDMNTYNRIKYIRADRVELMVKLAVLKAQQYDWQCRYGINIVSPDPFEDKIQTIKDRLQ